jgi:uncharacterized delta-60 repeat protein
MTAPVLDNSASPSLPTILEGATNPAGIAIADLVVDGSITDPDGPAIEAIGITGLNTSFGAWQYSLDSGATWLTIQDQQLNTVANERALLLGPTAMLRLLPFGDLTGTLPDAVTFRAWDQSSGSEGQYVATSAGGGDTAFSAAVDTASVTVEPDDSVPSPPDTNQGDVLTDFSSGAYDFATSVTVQPDGKVVVAGSSQSNGTYGFAVVRYNSDGSLDTTFNGTGKSLPLFGANDWAWTTTVQPDGRLLVGGTTGASSVLIRYNEDGSPDTSFDGTGQLVSNTVNFGESLALQSDGRIVVAGLTYTGTFDFAVARYNPDGAADTSFNGTGSVVTDFSAGSDFARAVAVQVDGKIVVLGQRDMGGTYNTFLELARYNPDGSLDTSFDGSGKLVTGEHATSFTGGGLAMQSDGKILVAGESYANGIFDTDFALARLNPDGSPDTTFGVGGTVVTDMGANRQDMASRVIVQPDGKILVAGSTDVDGTWNFALVRYNPDGSLDTTFNGTGKVSTDIGNHSIDYAYGLTLQPDGKIVVTGTSDAHGSYDFAVTRYNADGSLDSTFGGSNLFQYAPDGAPILLSDKIAIYDTVLAHLNGGAGNYAGASMTLSRDGGADPQDVFSAVGELSFGASNVVLSGVVVGTVTNAAGNLTIVFNSAATQERVNGVLSHIAYANSSDSPPPEVVIDYGFGTGSATLGLSAVAQPVVGSVNVEILGAEALTAPVLDTSASPSLPTILEGAIHPVGITIADLVVDGSITDPDGPAVEAIAITGLNTSLGAWQYSLDSGASWLTIQADQINSTTNELALLLGPTAMVRLLPFGKLTGALSDAITFRAWDESSGSQGQYVVIDAPGGTSAFSAASDTASATVTHANAAPTFGASGSGAASTDINGDDIAGAAGIAIEPDGKIVLGGTITNSSPILAFALARYDADGGLDTSFSADGKLIMNIGAGTYDQANDVAVQADGRILLVGSTVNQDLQRDFGLVRYNVDGSLDTSFNGTGKVVTDIGSDLGDFGSNTVTPAKYIGDLGNSVAIQADGKIVLAGYSTTGDGYDLPDFSVARYNPDGSLDTSFAGTGTATTDISNHSIDRGYAVALQADGKTLVAGDTQGAGSKDFAVVRYNVDGSLDSTFNGSGKVVTDIGNNSTDDAYCLSVQADGKILVAGHTIDGSGDHIAVVRYNVDGSLDGTFNGSGKVVTTVASGSFDAAYHIEVLPGGRILVVGASDSNIVLVRYNSNGSLDTSFNQSGIANAGPGFATDATVEPDGKIVVAAELPGASADFAAFRFNADGSPDTTFGATNTVGGTFAYTENSAPVALDSSVNIYDAELAALASGAGNYAGASVSLSRHDGADGHDLFSALGGLSFGNGNAVLSGVTVGTVTNSGGHLTITFNSNATQARVNAVLSDLAYANSSDTPPASVTIDYVFSDGNTGAQGPGGAQSTTASVTVNITAVNDSPTGSVAIAGTVAWGQMLTASNTLTDADGLGTISYEWLANGSPIGGATGNTFTVTPDLAGKTITVTASYTDLGGHAESVASAATAPVPLVGGLFGTSGPDTFIGGAGNDLLSGLGGNDTLQGVAGDDTLIGGTGNDSMNGGEGSDLYVVSTSAEHTVAEIADTGATGTDEVRFAASGSSTLTLFAGDTGIELVVIGTGTDPLANSTATTALSVNASAVTNALWIVGNAGANTLTGTAFNDTLDGGAGNDKMAGGNGNDTYVVDSASDVVTESSASGGTDLVLASVSYTLGTNVENLTLTGSAATNGTGNALSNTITGNSARNVIDGKAGVDHLDGGDGSDLYMIGLAGDHTAGEIADTGASGTDEVRFASTKASTLTLYAGDTGIEQVTIGTGTGIAPVATGTAALNVNAAAVTNALSITGNAGANILTGTAFDDTLNGGAGADTLVGGSGNDTLVGGNGSDVLTGGAGADAFVFNLAPNASSNKDTITDFTSSTDVLQLSKTIFTAISGAVGGLAIEQFWSGAGAVAGHDADDRIVYNTTTGVLYYDADGSGSGSAVQIALLGTATHPALAYTDIFLAA